MVFNATFNNISAISWRSVLLVDETGENHRPAISYFITQCCIEYTSPWPEYIAIVEEHIAQYICWQGMQQMK